MLVGPTITIVLPSCLALQFLNNQSICFLGVNVSQKIGILNGSSLKFVVNSFTTAVDIGTFAAKGLQNPSLKGCTNLVDLSSRVGLSILKEEAFAATDRQGGAFSLSGLTTTSQLPDWGTSVCFSKEEVKYAMFEAYMCYTMGTKIMTTL
ncbi:hypothetical protein M9H77_27304 [Catharanthus roseus]|uniref:Uncharacterized protein n=1 Tax=Catharanthus roseus TaxID=4058 RepID=A0ACC0ACN6_CATRO|nr:hypothetical protein M9H77_27304 [Catharanthus roseus]